jgi:hypothetical protein
MALKLNTELLTRKLGPMPTWAWMLAGLGVAVIYKTVRDNKKASDAASADGSSTGEAAGAQLIGGDQAPPVVFQNYTTITNPIVPSGAGRLHPPAAPPPPGPAPTTLPAITPVPAPAGGPAPYHPPAPAAPRGTWVTVAKFTTKNPPWNSTLSGIAKQLKGSASTATWSAIWNAPENAAERTRRKAPNLIQPGDRIFVPA